MKILINEKVGPIGREDELLVVRKLLPDKNSKLSSNEKMVLATIVVCLFLGAYLNNPQANSTIVAALALGALGLIALPQRSTIYKRFQPEHACQTIIEKISGTFKPKASRMAHQRPMN
jgi:hypothetical protein